MSLNEHLSPGGMNSGTVSTRGALDPAARLPMRPRLLIEPVETAINMDGIRKLALRAPVIASSGGLQSVMMLFDEMPSLNSIQRLVSLAKSLQLMSEAYSGCGEILLGESIGDTLRAEMQARLNLKKATEGAGMVPPLVPPVTLVPERERAHA